MLYRTKTDRFVDQRKQEWLILEDLQKRSNASWTRTELKEFPSSLPIPLQ
jgi:hypothetical protein